MSQPNGSIPSLAEALDSFLADLENAGKSAHTIRSYRSDLQRFLAHHAGGWADLDLEGLRTYLSGLRDKSLATRARHQASLSAFLAWGQRQGYLEANPAALLDRVQVEEKPPRALPKADVEKILRAIPAKRLRDRLLFTLIAETGLRISEALNIYVEDLDLTPDDEKILVRGKGKTARTVMLYAAPRSLKLLQRYLAQSGITSGALFRGNERKGGSRSPIRYRTAAQAWARYCEQAGVSATVHQLRHSFATELVNDGVRLEVVRKLLGHKNMQTTLRYAEVNDQTVKEELRRRRSPR